ncbi:hypothetical protein J25TS5_14600 [Paenibacillus faecis]|uniref:glycine zipper domain-containing protein n=1 Tax=Paenibacillus faecis TaxID=862114 RepID=UPI001B0AE1A6|nr:glycine zipper domain-containing protein [Paenibacillus faecis]GIO84528.1 hypothetical protein J25TS5_14600 [Paenibacillus faecis]
MIIASTTKVTVPFEAHDLLSGALRQMRKLMQGASDDLLEFKRRSGSTFDGFVSNGRRARESVDDFGRRVNGAADELRRLGRTQVNDPFRRARAGADELRRSANRADSEIKGLSDAHVRLRADDQISPLIDTISTKISTLAATAGGIAIGGSITDSMFGGVMDYSREAARSASYVPAAERTEALAINDKLYAQSIVPNRAAGASNLADIAPMIADKSAVPDAYSASAKLQYILPNSSSEEINRAIAQGSSIFKEAPTQIADSIAYSYASVGDRQQDLLDTVWEYAGFFKNAGVNSEQMSNFFVKTIQEGAYNFDKPADFFKETFGVKALNTGDMQKYFELRGAGKDEAARQAQVFTNDINSGDSQRMQGAIAALIGDLASQTQNELKQSLTTLGSATAEDNASSILKTYGVPFEKAPNMQGTLDRLIATQQAADPMTSVRQTRAEIDLQLQEIGTNLTTAALPALKEFNDLLVENKDEIQAFGTGIANAVTNAVGFYKDHMTAINTALMGLGAALVVKGIVSFGKSVRQLNANVFSAAKWIGNNGKTAVNVTGRAVKSGWDRLRGGSSQTYDPAAEKGRRIRERMGGRGVRRGFGRRSPTLFGGGLGGLGSASSMAINASVVYLNGSVAGGIGGDIGGSGRRGGKRGRRGGGRRRGGLGGGRRGLGARSGGGALLGSRENPWRVRGFTPPTPTLEPPAPRGNWLGKVGGTLGKGAKYLKPVAKAAGIVGTVANVGMSAYDLIQASKQDGIKEALSTTGGSMVGSTAGGVAGGAIGSLLGPVGTAVGAAAGSWFGEKLGKMADESGLTRKVVDGAVNIFNSAKDTWTGVKNWFTGGKKEEKQEKPGPPPESKITFSGLTDQKQQRLTQIGEEVRKSIADKGLKAGLKTIADQPEVKRGLNAFKTAWGAVWKLGDSDKTQKSIKDVGTATKSSAAEIAKGAAKNKQSINSFSAAAKTAVEKTKQHLMSLKNVSSQGGSWGSDLMSRFVAGMRGQFPTLSSVVGNVAVVVKQMTDANAANSGGGVTSKPNPKPYAQGGYINRPHVGLVGEAGPEMIIPLSANRRSRGRELWERAGIIMGVRPYANGGQVGRPSLIGASSMMPMAQMLNPSVSAAPKSVSIENINLDFGELAKGITNFVEFAKMFSSPQGRALIRKVVGEELIKVLENGG